MMMLQAAKTSSMPAASAVLLRQLMGNTAAFSTQVTLFAWQLLARLYLRSEGLLHQLIAVAARLACAKVLQLHAEQPSWQSATLSDKLKDQLCCYAPV
jgi:hypothetical protein